MNPDNEYIESALGSMSARGPKPLRAYLAKPGPDLDEAEPARVEQMIERLLTGNPNDPSRLAFSGLIRKWDNEKSEHWTDGTARNTLARRKLIYKLLKADEALEERIDKALPFYPLDEPVVISETHTDWYKPNPAREYYWKAYVNYLKTQRSWREESLLSLDNTTRAIIECLANPESNAAYASRGLVMGYVQSGKTANFTGVAARAADAGYRLLIILAGTWNILRNQTQRRFDKELLGKELLHNDESYQEPYPADWDEFLSHGFKPADRDIYSWQRLTRPEIDFKRLKSSIDTLEFSRRNQALPIYHPDNLHAMPVKLLVVKKHSVILKNLVKDLKLSNTALRDLPALIIDDESDQAGINTKKPNASSAAAKERTSTNLAIVELLKLLPRGQYIGYSATPYANALVDPTDPEDLFPKDFIVSLERPHGYMGVSDFFDPYRDITELNLTDFSEPEIAFIRRVSTPSGQDTKELLDAIRSYVLAGAIKLYRLAKDPEKYRTEFYKHHTMLIHTSSKIGQHATIYDSVVDLWDQCAFNGPNGVKKLKDLWDTDYRKVCLAHEPKDLIPDDFSELLPYLTAALKLIQADNKFIRVVNSDKDEAPDFTADRVWKIVIGGNKLSRGYTIEGLTVSYYRRTTTTADTLMQMGRWFGFRPGYRDLVRVFLGVADGRNGSTDLVDNFKDVCIMEENFRSDIKRYVRTPGSHPITPSQVPPLISVTGNLPPTARNKMFNATISSKNYEEQWSMPTSAPAKSAGILKNQEVFRRLITDVKPKSPITFGGVTGAGKTINADCIVGEATMASVVQFLKSYVWIEDPYKAGERPADIGYQLEYMANKLNGIKSWLIMAPQRKVSFGDAFKADDSISFNVKSRKRIEGKRFQVYGEPDYRIIAEYLTGKKDRKIDLVTPDKNCKEYADPSRGILLLFPVRVIATGDVTIGFEILYPKGSMPFDVSFTVRDKNAGVVTGPAPA